MLARRNLVHVAAFLAGTLIASMSDANEPVIQLYDGVPPGSESWNHAEKESTENVFRTRLVYNVTQPTLTVFTPKDSNGTALIICPGGGFHCLSIDSEGNDVALWLNRKGITCFVLKYRLVKCKTSDPGMELMMKGLAAEDDILPVIPLAMEDGLQAIRYVRTHAKQLNVNPRRIGMIGFSAGGTLAISVAHNCDPESRPDFLASIYAQYDWAIKEKEPSSKRPPLFIAAATDDQLGLAEHSLRLYRAWLSAKTPAEMHLYEKGGHGFGMRKQSLPSDGWIEAFSDWMARRIDF